MPLVVPGIHTSLTGDEKTAWIDKLLGKTLTDNTNNEISFAKKDLPARHRVLKLDTAITEDYVENRMNIYVDDEGTVRDVRFGFQTQQQPMGGRRDPASWFRVEAAPVRIPTGQTHDLPCSFRPHFHHVFPLNHCSLDQPSVPAHTMQFVFARRGRRVFQRLNIRQAAALSTRASPAVEQPIRRVSRLSNARTATTVVKSAYSPVARLNNANQWARCYATAAAESKTGKTTAGRPKKTGTAAKKPAKPKAKKAKKPKKKVVKPKAKPTEEQLAKKKATREKQKLKDDFQKTKAESLVETEPKTTMSHPWPLFVKKRLQGSKGVITSQLSTISAEYKNLPSSEREELSRELEKYNQESIRAYDEWVNSHTPLQIKNANIARRRLAALTADKKTSIKLSQIKDERQVKRPRTTFILFFKDRINSGDFKHLTSTEMSSQATSEYNALSAPEKEKYTKLAEQDLERYRRESKEVYGEESS
ncbi:uncharacterized protein TRUGW13939_03184 [Talaromyces rugulosus]|uniref:HMG box domain-containing protein n=1 Tax=Talaromyces rugulosus TaxID=121627 RepID=A0A7H8QQ53_TALRU|nr:uncharacterized protein TRUGW13939_03184 [Talaromyces rugulosus]QKX56084.1 hypothetical protein TRUGW13939_03184 [Talaromyces rugulosus]